MSKALFFDIDGTLVSFDTHVIPQSAIEAITKAKEAGHKIVISTGRPPAIINNLGQLQDRGLIDGYITMNGAYCFIGNEVLYKHPIPHDQAQAIASFCKANGFPCIFVGEHSMTIAGPQKWAISIFIDDMHTPPIPFTDYEAPLRHELFQITPFFTAEQQKEIAPGLPDCELGRWHPAFVDITGRGCTKAKGIDIVLDRLGLPLSDAIAFGDGGNDIPMIKHAGIGVAMGNANPEVKAAADYVTAPIDNDGIASSFAHLGLI